MKKLHLIRSVFVGIGAGTLISTVFSSLYSTQYLPYNPYSTLGAYYSSHLSGSQSMVVCLAVWALIGLMFEIGCLIFNNNWSLLKKTFSHYALMLLGFTPLSVLGAWFPINVAEIVSIIIEFTVIYAVIYLISFKKMKAEINRINHHLAQNR